MTTSTDRRFGVNPAAGWKNPVIAASTANLTLSGEQTVDGIALVADDRVFAKDQTDTTENGIYVVSTGDWSRDADFDGAYDVVEHSLIPVARGTENAATWWRVTNTGTITIGTTNLTFESIGVVGLTRGNAVTLAGTETSQAFSIKSGANQVVFMYHALGTNAGGANGVPRVIPNDSSSIVGGIGTLDGADDSLGGTAASILLSAAGTAPHDWADDHSLSGSVIFNRLTGNTWAYQGMSRNSADTDIHFFGGVEVLSAELSTLTLDTAGGTAVFDASGIVNVQYQ